MRDAIAIIGMAYRVPGASNVDEFWQPMADGIEHFHRVGIDGLGGWPDYLDLFDAGRFGISPHHRSGPHPGHRTGRR